VSTDITARWPRRPTIPHTPASHVAQALVHLLDPGRDRPARWFHPGFVAEVTRERHRLHHVVRGHELVVYPSLDGSFAATAERLARDPVLVATALRKLEIDRSAGLPAWEDLVRRGLPATPSPIETATWFG
jgi:hypothetical protein